MRDLTGREPYMAAATVGALFVGVVTVTSLRSLRRRLAYETWYFVHLLAYAGLALAFAHQLALGGDLADDRLARVVLGRPAPRGDRGARVGPVGDDAGAALARAGGAVVPVGGGTADAPPVGGGPRSADARPGQFFLSACCGPVSGGTRTRTRSRPRPPPASCASRSRSGATPATTSAGSRPAREVAVEGPYGTCTPALAGGRRVLFVVGGVGVAPARAMIEHLDQRHSPVVLYRARWLAEATHLHELQALLDPRGGRVLTLLGPTTALAHDDPFGAASLRGAVPDVAERVAIVCGPESLVHAARAAFWPAASRPSDIHFERAWW